MGIPEHDKCVRMWKDIRRKNRICHWGESRRIQRKGSKIYRKYRFRNILKASSLVDKYEILRSGYTSIRELSIKTFGQHYRRWGKYPYD